MFCSFCLNVNINVSVHFSALRYFIFDSRITIEWEILISDQEEILCKPEEFGMYIFLNTFSVPQFPLL